MGWFIVTSILIVFFSFQPVVNISILNLLIDSISKLSQKGTGLGFVFGILIFQLFFSVINSLLINLQIYLDNVCQIKLEYFLDILLTDKIRNAPYGNFEDVNFQNQLDRISFNKGNRFISPLKATLDLIKCTISFMLMFGFLYKLNPMISLLFVSFVPLVFVNIKLGKMKFDLHIFQSPQARKMSYVNSLLTDRHHQAELRTYDLNEYFQNIWKRLYIVLNKKVIQLNLRNVILNSIVILFEGLLFFVVSYTSVKMIITGKLSVGGFIALTQSIVMVNSLLEEISNDVSTIYNEGFFLQDLFNFLDLDLTSISKLETKNKKSLTQEDFDSVSNGETIIEFKHVKFDYPNSNQHVLNDISFSIKKGEKVFLVGANGVGKTTIIDCLLGLYPIDKGTILILGENLEQIDPVSLKENFSVIFQNYIRYNLTLKDNIILKEKYNKKKFDDTIKESNLNSLVDRLSKKEETYLGKMFIAGEDLSGGQWQKVALARSIYKNSNIFILDEPTASLDAETENDVYSLMREEKKKKPLFLHRIGWHLPKWPIEFYLLRTVPWLRLIRMIT